MCFTCVSNLVDVSGTRIRLWPSVVLIPDGVDQVGLNSIQLNSALGCNDLKKNKIDVCYITIYVSYRFVYLVLYAIPATDPH